MGQNAVPPNRRVAWLGAGDSHLCGGSTKCSCPAEARGASKTKSKLWNRGFMYKWREELLLLRGRFRLSPAESEQSRLFIESQIDLDDLQHSPLLP